MTKELELLVTEDGSHTLFNYHLNERYHSSHGAVQESLHVFIEAGLKFVLPKTDEIQILEVGFGTGLNAFLTLLKSQETSHKFNYLTFETLPLPLTLVKELNYPAQLNHPQSSALFQNLHVLPWNQPNSLAPNFIFEKTHARLQAANLSQNSFDVIFFDAFAPEKQPEMWQKDVFEKLFACLKPSGILVTYCAKGAVKRNLKSVDFHVETLPGPGRKREMVRAHKTSNQVVR